MSGWMKKNWFWLGVNVAAAIPLLWLAWDFWQGNLSVNPIDDITDRTGKAAIILLILSLSCTPALIVFGWRRPLQVRKALGMFAFVYASFHLLNFVGLDYGFNMALIFSDGLQTKPYIMIGLLAFLLLVPLALTSTDGWKVRLGKGWKRLHRLAYIAAPAAVIHFLWLAKAAEDFEPLIYGTILGLLLLVRVPPVRKRLVAWRQRRSRAGAPSPAPSALPTGAAGDKA
jgi:sulfoxide reductase heme-binding subunit YedZ